MDVSKIDRTLFTEFYHTSKLGVMIASTIGFALPPRWMGWIFYPLYFYQKWSARKKYYALCRLHHIVTTIVPGVKLEDSRIINGDPDRYSIEIIEGLEVICSHTINHQMGNVSRDLQFLRELYNKKLQYHGYGPYNVISLDDLYLEALSRALMLNSELPSSPAGAPWSLPPSH